MTLKEIKLVPFKELLPLQLKNSVSGASQKTAGDVQNSSNVSNILNVKVEWVNKSILTSFYRCLLSSRNGGDVCLHETA